MPNPMPPQEPDNLPVGPVPGSRPPAGLQPNLAPWYGPEPEPEQPAVTLAHYLWILKRHRWKILSFVAASLVATAIVSSRVTPIYESTATIDVDRRVPSGIVGQESVQSPAIDADQFLATQVKLIQSDSVLRPVVRKFNLRETEEPARAESGAGGISATAPEDAPVALKRLKVTRPPNTYLLLISYRSPDPALSAAVANAIANSYIEHTYNIRYHSSSRLSTFMEKQLEELKAKMERSSEALARFERELNVINPEEKTSILSARLLQLNTEYTNAQGDRVRKEAAYNSVRGGSADAAQNSPQGEPLRRLTERLYEAQEKFAQVKTHYGANHPEYRKAASQVSQLQLQLDQTLKSILRRVEIEYREALNREGMLKKSVAETKAEFDRLNARSFEYENLKREAVADKKLYEELVTRIREAGINAGFQNSAIRLADPARPALSPVFPNLKLNLALAFLFSSFLAMGAAVLSDVLDNTVRDPEQVRCALGAEVIGSLPYVRDWRKKKRLVPKPNARTVSPGLGLKSAGIASSTALVPVAAPKVPDAFHEAIHTVRNSVLLGSSNRVLRSLLVTSAAPQEGKTTAAVHLAIAHAEQRRKTLLIEADLRRPGVCRAFGIGETAGLGHALSDGMVWRDKLVKAEGLPDLDILPAGAVDHRSAHLLGPSLNRLLEEAEASYDLVVLDAPPLLGFPEPLQMAAAVDGVVVVAHAGRTNKKALGSVLAALQRVRANVVGVVLNEVSKDVGEGYGYYGYYGKYHNYYGVRRDSAS